MDPTFFALHQIGSLAEAPNLTEIRAQLGSITQCLGFDHFLFVLQVQGISRPAQFVLNGFPESWQQQYNDGDYARIDPTLAHCQSRRTPLVWTQAPQTPQTEKYWEQARAAGLGNGLSIPVHELRGIKSMLSLARAKVIEKSSLPALLASARVLAESAHFAVARLALPAVTGLAWAGITPRERDILRNTARGMTSAQMARALKITERTVEFHFRNLMTKLNCCNRAQVIAKSASIGLLD